jgi:TolB-like protein
MALLLAATSCAASRQLSHIEGTPLAGHPRVAVLPLENLSGTVDAGRSLTQIVVAELAASGICDVVETGNAERAVRVLRIRDTSAPTTAEVRALGDTLGAKFLLCGVVLEQARIDTPDGDIPTIAAAFKLLEVPTARVIWGKVVVRTGEDHETLFGWGRVTDGSRVASQLATDAIADMRRLAGSPAKPASGSQP